MNLTLRPMRLDLADMQILSDLLQFDRMKHEPLRTPESRLQDRTAEGCMAMGAVAECDGCPVGVSTLLKPLQDLCPEAIGIWVVVHPDHREMGIGRRLADAHTALCVEAGFTAQMTSVSLEERPALALAASAGFQEIDRGWHLTFDIGTWDATAGAKVLQAAQEARVEVLSLAELVRRHDDWSSRLHPLALECAQDIPTTMDLSAEDLVGATLEVFQSKLQTMRSDMDASVVAMVDGCCVATSWITRPTDEVCAVCMTGTLRAHRRQGLAKVLKQATLKWCAANGVRWLNTQQHESNMPMLELNKNIGFTVQYGHAILRRDLKNE